MFLYDAPAKYHFQMFLVVAIGETCPPSEADVITLVLLNLFDTRASLLTLLKLLIEREVKTTSKSAFLFGYIHPSDMHCSNRAGPI